MTLNRSVPTDTLLPQVICQGVAAVAWLTKKVEFSEHSVGTKASDENGCCIPGGEARMHYLLFYEVGEDYVSRRAEFRDAHLEKAWKASSRGELVLAGAFANPVDGAVLLFKGDSPEVAEKFAREDPYVTNGAVKRWYVREWTTVAGEDAMTPIRPKAVAASKEGLSNLPKSIQTEKGPVLRLWKGRSTAERASEYVHHATKKVFPALRAIDGHRGAYLLRRVVDSAIEFVVLTLWDSMATVRRFAGAEPDKAVVEAEARAILTTFDDRATHYEIVQGMERAQDERPSGS